MEDKRYAVLIDGDNISSKYIGNILDEMSKYGVITYKRIYGDWTSSNASKWKKELLENSITPIQQFSNTVGKNATDSTLIIDAMDILYTKNVDGFCIVSSDSDFTRLASRLRESGMDVIGMGEDKTPRAFRAACTVFTNLEVLLEEDIEEEEKPKDKGKNSNIDKETIEKDIQSIISENDNKDKATDLAEIGNRLLKKYPDFDVRTYGYSALSRFLEELGSLELIRNNQNSSVTVKVKKLSRHIIIDFVIDEVKKAGKKGVDLSIIGQRVHNKYPSFNVKNYGYANLNKFVKGIEELTMTDMGDYKLVLLKNNA